MIGAKYMKSMLLHGRLNSFSIPDSGGEQPAYLREMIFRLGWKGLFRAGLGTRNILCVVTKASSTMFLIKRSCWMVCALKVGQSCAGQDANCPRASMPSTLQQRWQSRL